MSGMPLVAVGAGNKGVAYGCGVYGTWKCELVGEGSHVGVLPGTVMGSGQSAVAVATGCDESSPTGVHCRRGSRGGDPCEPRTSAAAGHCAGAGRDRFVVGSTRMALRRCDVSRPRGGGAEYGRSHNRLSSYRLASAETARFAALSSHDCVISVGYALLAHEAYGYAE